MPHSIHDLPPLERGGVVARHGFDVQDHVAASFILLMIEKPELLQVWCETHDDITLIWQGSSGEEIEFVQVKSSELNQLWSVAKLCEREKVGADSKAGTSIYERSLANDRCRESCRFRLVTCRPVHTDLYALTLPPSSPDRASKQADLVVMAQDIDGRATGFQSPNGNGSAFWISQLLWDVRHSLETVKTANIAMLRRLVEQNGGYLFSDQLDDLYSSLLTKARSAATAEWGVAPEQKKLIRESVVAWFNRTLSCRLHPIPATGGASLTTKMTAAAIGEAEIESSLETRRHYLAERLQPKYLSLSEREHVEGEVTATLHALRAQLDAGELPDSGVDFHAKCINALQGLQNRLPTTRPVPLVFLLGCMYSITDRCTHRFRRATA